VVVMMATSRTRIMTMGTMRPTTNTKKKNLIPSPRTIQSLTYHPTRRSKPGSPEEEHF
jgi:hypothetical protein